MQNPIKSCSKLSCQLGDITDRIDKLQVGQRTTTKMNKTLWREVAVTMANELYKSEDKLIACHRKEADNDFLTAFIGELKDKVQVKTFFIVFLEYLLISTEILSDISLEI